RIPPLPHKGTPTLYQLKLVKDRMPNPPPPGGREPTLSQNRSTIETRARVVSTSSGKGWVEASSQQGCAACQSQSSCGVSGLGKFFNRNKPPVALACDLAVQPGDSLVLSLAEADLLRAGLLAYLLPALLSVAGAIAATLAGLGDAAAAAAMAAGFAAGLIVARVFARAPRFHISRPTDSPTPGDPHD
ncbi:MAG TPA: SoxR reducing system RseC family protein, partial [Thiobacillaceae bacterium]